MSTVEMEEKLPKLANRAIIAGKLVALEPISFGVNKNNVKWMSFKGRIQYGESRAMQMRFSVYLNEKTSKGNENKAYKNMYEWYNNAKPQTTTPNEEDVTMVELVGSVIFNDYMNKENKYTEATDWRMSLVNNFQKYRCEWQADGIITSVVDEENDGVATGRKIVRLLTVDNFNNVIRINNLIAPLDNGQGFNVAAGLDEYGYEEGVSAQFNMEMQLKTEAQTARKATGMGVTTATTRPQTELVMIGSNEIYEEGHSQNISSELLKTMKKMWVQKKKSIEDAGYKGGASKPATSSNSAPARSTSGFGVASAPTPAVDEFDTFDASAGETDAKNGQSIDADDIPF